MTATAEVETVQIPAQHRPGRIVAVNPLEHEGWDELVAEHPDANFFHGTAWARVLAETYGHKPLYLTRLGEAGELLDLLPLMEVNSALTGRRGVSLPFTDFARPLKTSGQSGGELYEQAMEEGRRRGWKYLECRGSDTEWKGSSPSVVFYGHTLDLRGGEAQLFKNLDGPMRRGIRKAEAAGLRIQIDDTLDSVHTYYALHCQTRRRHGLPPQPFRFFLNIQRHMLEPGHGFIVIARSEEKPIAAAIFFHGGHQALYKFGASDFRYQEFRPNNLVMWQGIRQCAARGCASLHLGRTSLANEGLQRFKLAFGAVEEEVKYARYDFKAGQFTEDVDRAHSWANHVFGAMPAPLLRLAGRVLYPHVS